MTPHSPNPAGPDMSYALRVPKELRPWIRAATEQGWVLSQGRMAHPKLTAPDGYSTPIPTSTNSVRLMREVQARLRKHGVEPT